MTDPTKLSDSELVDFLLKTPAEDLTSAQRLALRDRRPTPQLSLVSNKSKFVRHFHSKWYEKVTWLTGCSVRNKMFCYTCLLMGIKETDVCTAGLADLQNFHRVTNRHQISKSHIKATEDLIFLDKPPQRAVMTPHETDAVIANRQVLRRLLQGMIFLSSQDLPPGSHDDSGGNFEQLLSLLAQNELLVRQHIETSPVFNGKLAQILTDLIAVVSGLLAEKIQTEIRDALFVSLQVDDVTDLTCQSQFSVIFRFCVDSSPQERFAGLYNIREPRSGKTMFDAIRKVLEHFGVKAAKLVSQSYDGQFVSSDGGKLQGVYAWVKDSFPKSLFMHSHAHSLNLELLKGTMMVPEFGRGLATLASFFDSATLRFQLLVRKFGSQLTSWDFETNPAQTIVKNFSVIRRVCTSVVKGPYWDVDSIKGAKEVLDLLDSQNFLFMACLYEQCFKILKPLKKAAGKTVQEHYENIYTTTLKLQTLGAEEKLVDDCVEKCSSLNETLSFSKATKSALASIANKTVQGIVSLVFARFNDYPITEFVELLDPLYFAAYDLISLPLLSVTRVLDRYPSFNREQLVNELANIYEDPRKRLQPHDLLQYLYDSGLKEVYAEVVRLLKLIHTLPTNPISRLTQGLTRNVIPAPARKYYKVVSLPPDKVHPKSRNEKRWKAYHQYDTGKRAASVPDGPAPSKVAKVTGKAAGPSSKGSKSTARSVSSSVGSGANCFATQRSEGDGNVTVSSEELASADDQPVSVFIKMEPVDSDEMNTPDMSADFDPTPEMKIDIDEDFEMQNADTLNFVKTEMDEPEDVSSSTYDDSSVTQTCNVEGTAYVHDAPGSATSDSAPTTSGPDSFSLSAQPDDTSSSTGTVPSVTQPGGAFISSTLPGMSEASSTGPTPSNEQLTTSSILPDLLASVSSTGSSPGQLPDGPSEPEPGSAVSTIASSVPSGSSEGQSDASHPPSVIKRESSPVPNEPSPASTSTVAKSESPNKSQDQPGIILVNLSTASISEILAKTGCKELTVRIPPLAPFYNQKFEPKPPPDPPVNASETSDPQASPSGSSIPVVPKREPNSCDNQPVSNSNVELEYSLENPFLPSSPPRSDNSVVPNSVPSPSKVSAVPSPNPPASTPQGNSVPSLGLKPKTPQNTPTASSRSRSPPSDISGVTDRKEKSEKKGVKKETNPADCSTLYRVRSYLKKCMKDARLSCWGALSVERHLLSELVAKPGFVDHVIDLYAKKTGLESHFIPASF